MHWLFYDSFNCGSSIRFSARSIVSTISIFTLFFFLAGKRFVGKDAVKRGQPSGILQSRLK